MSKSLLAKLLGTGALASAATAVAAGGIQLSDEQTTAGNDEMARLVGLAAEDGIAQGRQAERERMGAVLTNDAAQGRMGLAITMLSTTDNTAEQIITCLNASETEASAAPAAPAAAAPVPAAPAPAQVPAQPLAADPLAASTPRVDVGNASANANEPGEVDHVASWNQSFTNEASAITRGGFAVAGTRPAAA